MIKAGWNTPADDCAPNPINRAAYNLDGKSLGRVTDVLLDGVRVEKKHLELPKKLVNIIHCKNPRCITVAEPQLDAIFLLSDPEKHTYRCAYCDTAKDKRF